MMKYNKIYILILISICYSSHAALPVIEAAQKGDLARIKALLNKRSTIPIPTNSNGAHALHFASFYNHLAVVKVLIDHNAPIDVGTVRTTDFNLGKNLRNNLGGVSPLMLAVFQGNMAIVKLLLELGANPNMQDDRGQTALHYAILVDLYWPNRPLNANQKKIVELLLSYGADPRLEDEQGNSALYYYTFLASLIPGPGPQEYTSDQDVAANDTLYKSMLQA